MFLAVLMFYACFCKKCFYSVKTCLFNVFFYLQINVFNIYALNIIMLLMQPFQDPLSKYFLLVSTILSKEGPALGVGASCPGHSTIFLHF